MLNAVHLRKAGVVPVIGVGRTVLLRGGIRKRVDVAAGQARDVRVDGLFPRVPANRAPTPGVVRREAVRALGAFNVRDGGRPARVDAVSPGSARERLAIARKGRTSQVVVDARGPLGDEGILVGRPIGSVGRSRRRHGGAAGRRTRIRFGVRRSR